MSWSFRELKFDRVDCFDLNSASDKESDLSTKTYYCKIVLEQLESGLDKKKNSGLTGT